MSLDVEIYYDKKITRICAINENDEIIEITQDEWDSYFPGLTLIFPGDNGFNLNILYQDNITHNLAKMAKEAGIYKYIWMPEENNIKYAGDLIEYLKDGFCKLIINPKFYREFEPANNWGSYEGLLNFVMGYLEACKKHPKAKIYASG